jgi:hypothetical protein
VVISAEEVVVLRGGSWSCLGVVWMVGRGFFGLVLVSERFEDKSYNRGWQVLIR